MLENIKILYCDDNNGDFIANNRKYCGRVAVSAIFQILLNGDIALAVSYIDENPDVAKKLIFAGIVLAVGSIVSFIRILTFKFDDYKTSSDKETYKYIKKMQSLKKEFDKYVKRQKRQQER